MAGNVNRADEALSRYEAVQFSLPTTSPSSSSRPARAAAGTAATPSPNAATASSSSSTVRKIFYNSPLIRVPGPGALIIRRGPSKDSNINANANMSDSNCSLSQVPTKSKPSQQKLQLSAPALLDSPKRILSSAVATADKKSAGTSTASLTSATTSQSRIEPTKDEVDFQSLPQLPQRLGYMWQRRFHTDVIFIVGDAEEKIEAHRLILASSSPIFEQLLYQSTPLIMEEKYVLYESDFTASSFNVFLLILYTNEVPSSLPLKVAVDIFYISKKYEISYLQSMTLAHVNQLLSVANVFDILSISTKILELTHLIAKCWRLIESKTSQVLENHFETMTLTLLIRILDRETLDMDEFELFDYIVRWSTAECKRRKLKLTGKSKREVIEPLIKRIRFPTMALVLFQELVVPTGILSNYEITCIQDYLKRPNENSAKYLPYKLYKRHLPGPDHAKATAITTGITSSNASDSSRPQSALAYSSYYGSHDIDDEDEVQAQGQSRQPVRGKNKGAGKSGAGAGSVSVPSTARGVNATSTNSDLPKRVKSGRRQKSKVKTPQTHR